MEIKKDFSLLGYNTMSVQARAASWLEIASESDLLRVLPYREPILILGEGSNILFTKDFAGLVIANRIRGREIIAQTDRTLLLRVGAGENWHKLVEWAVENNWGGIENLSLIPGTVGAAPVQNIGAYGVEVCDCIHEVAAIHLGSGERRVFAAKECGFGYRESVFKSALRHQYCITAVTFELRKNPTTFELSYKDVSATLAAMGASKPTLADVHRAIIQIRQQKLYSPQEMPNTGSFFKNPIVDNHKIAALKAEYPNMPTFELAENSEARKIPAAWLIEQCGWRGKKMGAAAVSDRHALVLTNPDGAATGAQIWALAQAIQSDVAARFGVHIEAEVQIV
jgi:UDP-N-acetylmuramate dehydrogenase